MVTFITFLPLPPTHSCYKRCKNNTIFLVLIFIKSNRKRSLTLVSEFDIRGLYTLKQKYKEHEF